MSYQEITMDLRSGLLIVLALAFASSTWADDLPADRRINWFPAGLDTVGGIPTYPSVTCTGLDPTGATDSTSQIQACIDNAAANTAVFIPAGTYRITFSLNMKASIALRGARPVVSPWLPQANSAMTTLNMTNASTIDFDGGGKETNWNPGANSGIAITSGYTQGSTSITVSDASIFSVDDYISIYQNKDPAVIDDKGLDYLGEDCNGCSDPHVLQQYSRITAKSGNTLTIDPPVYYVTPNPTGQSVRRQTFMSLAGLENLRLNGNGTNIRFIQMDFTRNCWVKGVETYNVGYDGAGSPHVWIVWSYANEIRDSYFHHGVSRDSGGNYGIQFYNWNSRHKVENNVFRDLRHSMSSEGGNAGTVFLYNYTDDNGESVQGSGSVPDTSFLGEDEVANHGSHPHMNLFEGNNATSVWGDYTQGSSSHITVFRNYIRCKNTVQPLSSNPWLWSCVEIQKFNYYYNIVGNVIGLPSFTTGTVVWNQAGAAPAWPAIYRFGYNSAGGVYSDSQSFATVILNGNYNYVSDAVDNWTSLDHTLPSSLYYSTKPAFFGACAWPLYGPDVMPLTQSLPAQDRFNRTAGCASGPAPEAPTNLRVLTP
jgi:hypothetical protein